MANLAQPGGENTYTVNGEDYSDCISDFTLDEDSEKVEFKGSGGTPTKQWTTGSTVTGSFTAADDPTLGAILRNAVRTIPKPILDFTVDRYNTTAGSAAELMRIQITKLSAKAAAKDPNTMDVDFIVVEPLANPTVG